MALVLPQHENEGRDKHVESGSIPRLDESSTLSSSTNNANIQCVAQITPGFTPKKVKPANFFLTTIGISSPMRECSDNRMRILCLCFFIHYLLEGVIRDLNEHCRVVVALWKFLCIE